MIRSAILIAALATSAAVLASCDMGTPPEALSKFRDRTLGYAYGITGLGTTLHLRIVERLPGKRSLVVLCDNLFVTVKDGDVWHDDRLMETPTPCDEDLALKDRRP